MYLIHLLGQAVLGFVIGAAAKFALFIADVNDWILLGLIGAGGAILGTRIARQIFGMENNRVGWLFAVLGSVIILTIYYFARK